MVVSSKSIIAGFVVLLTFVSVNQWSRFPLGNTTITWIISFLTIFLCIKYKNEQFNPPNRKDYQIITFYFVWMLIGVARGVFVADNYWEWKQWVEGTLALSLPVFIYPFSDPKVLQKVLQTWIKWALPAFFILFLWIIKPGAYQFYLGPIILLSCFLPVVPKKWRFILIGALLLMLFSGFGARSQIIKTVAVILVAFGYLIGRYVSLTWLKPLHFVFYCAPVVVLVLGISGVFNPFKDLGPSKGKFVERRAVNGDFKDEDLAADTRTDIYVEVIQSAVRHDYVLQGRTPARGNDSVLFGSFGAEELKTGKYERHRNEVCFPNVFTWLGLIGMTLYGLIYLKSSYLAVYKSNNVFMKMVGVFIAFRFLYGWVEDFNKFDIMNITIWMMIAMGYSFKFRKMNNQEFEYWVRGICRI